MMAKCAVVSLLLICVCYSGSLAGNFREKIVNNKFKCLNGVYINRNKFCDGVKDCMDESDEDYCGEYSRSCPTSYKFFQCQSHNYHRCIPKIWVCDGIDDCPKKDDERDCDGGKASHSWWFFGREEVASRVKKLLPEHAEISLDIQNIGTVRRKAIRWIHQQARNRTYTDKWESHVQKTSVALYLADPNFVSPLYSFYDSHDTRKEMAYEVSIQLLSKFAQRKLKDVLTSDLSSHINALLVTCLDPRKFHSVNLVRELRSRVNGQNFPIPYDILTLCNVGEKITKKDIDKLIQSFWTHRREFWTENQAVTVMALVCAGNQPGSTFSLSNVSNFTTELKKKQSRNGTVENMPTTALVMQALFAAEPEDADNFDEEKAVQQIIREQRKDGSFGSILNTYYALPVLNLRSLVNISSDHCQSYTKDEDTGLQDLMNHVGPRMRIRYSVWIGDERDVERTLKLKVPTNTSFYGVMEIAGDLDAQFRFQYTVKNGRPYINAVSGIQDDVESGTYWFPYIFNVTKPSPVTISPAELIPKDNDHVVMWYRKGSWID